MQRCPYCGSEVGVFTTYTGRQFYFWNGEPAGYNADVPENQHKFARCLNCERKVKLSRLAEETPDGH